jgi:hypothetical protein
MVWSGEYGMSTEIEVSVSGRHSSLRGYDNCPRVIGLAVIDPGFALRRHEIIIENVNTSHTYLSLRTFDNNNVS